MHVRVVENNGAPLWLGVRSIFPGKQMRPGGMHEEMECTKVRLNEDEGRCTSTTGSFSFSFKF